MNSAAFDEERRGFRWEEDHHHHQQQQLTAGADLKTKVLETGFPRGDRLGSGSSALHISLLPIKSLVRDVFFGYTDQLVGLPVAR